MATKPRRCAWPKCQEEARAPRQLLWYCLPHATEVDATRTRLAETGGRDHVVKVYDPNQGPD